MAKMVHLLDLPNEIFGKIVDNINIELDVDQHRHLRLVNRKFNTFATPHIYRVFYISSIPQASAFFYQAHIEIQSKRVNPAYQIAAYAQREHAVALRTYELLQQHLELFTVDTRLPYMFQNMVQEISKETGFKNFIKYVAITPESKS